MHCTKTALLRSRGPKPCPGQRLEFGGSAAPPRLGSAAQLYGSSHPSPQTGQRGEMPVQKKQSDPSIGPNVHPDPVQETVCDLIAVRCYCLSNQDNTKRRGLSAYDATLQSLGGISVQQESLTTVTGQMTYFQFCERLPLRRISQIAKRKLASPKPTRLRTATHFCESCTGGPLCVASLTWAWWTMLSRPGCEGQPYAGRMIEGVRK